VLYTPDYDGNTILKLNARRQATVFASNGTPPEPEGIQTEKSEFLNSRFDTAGLS
jgi:hypothetical protein